MSQLHRSLVLRAFGTLVLFFAVLAMGSSTIMAQKVIKKDGISSIDTSKAVAPGSSLDSLLLSDSVRTRKPVVPAVPLFEPLHDHGSVMDRGAAPWITLDRHDIQRLFYTSFDELLETVLPATALHQGFYALPNTFSVLGGSAHDNAILFNGRPLNDLSTAMMPPNMYPTEFMQQAEILLGSEAVIAADNSSGMAINMQEPRYNAKTPYTRLWYAEGAGGYISSDGTFSQNIAPNWNMTLGYRREAGDGRYTNQAVDSWNLRALLRWNMSERTNISFVELFTNRYMDLNGGVDTAGTVSIDNELTAQVRFPLLNERIIRHDISATLSSLLSADSSSRLQVCVYYSHAAWHLGRDSSLIVNNSDSALGLNWGSVRTGATARMEQDLFQKMHLSFGADAEVQSADSTDYLERVSQLRIAAFGQMRLLLSESMQLSGGARLQQLGSKTSLSLGARIDLRLSDHWRLRGDLSQSARIASAAELPSLSQEHTTLLFAELQYHDPTLFASVLGFSRVVLNPIVATEVWDLTAQRILNTTFATKDTRLVSGAVLQGGWNDGRWHFMAKVQPNFSQLNGSNDKLLPSLFVSASAEYVYPLGKNLLSIGAATKWRSAYTGESFIPQNWSYVTADVPQGAALGGIDLIAGAKIGDAFIKLSYQNILSNSYSSLSTFPSVVRNFSLSIAWTFFD